MASKLMPLPFLRGMGSSLSEWINLWNFAKKLNDKTSKSQDDAKPKANKTTKAQSTQRST